ncbi:GNAT family protein [Brevundimonas sp.]|uniref:GNAT family N-acetyltransferase n=1 Tax=Brevundimonas sp. TaxID=1871086 RepID=UPI001D4C841A|nr:GNAT family protein [Brevundimonas sp.]MBL0946675.1 GNAT family N-acetyltransferase [Brevundimonas sp.]
MAILDWIGERSGPTLQSEGVLLRPPRPADYEAWAALRAASRDHLVPFEPTWPEDDLTRSAFRRRLALYGREMDLGTAWPFFVFEAGMGQLVGAVTLSHIRRGVSEAGTLGYWIGQSHAGKGYCTAAVRGMVAFAFDTLKLHRVEAACVPWNVASRRVLEKAGFEAEGRARAYLKINGEWADHLLYGRVDDRHGGGAAEAPGEDHSDA